jgi:anti-sigma B factor antagonist
MTRVRIGLASEGHIELGFSGNLDALTAGELRETLDEVIAERPRRVTLDFDALTNLDSSGVGAIVSLFKRLRANGGELTIANARDQPLEVLRLIDIRRLLLPAAERKRHAAVDLLRDHRALASLVRWCTSNASPQESRPLA